MKTAATPKTAPPTGCDPQAARLHRIKRQLARIDDRAEAIHEALARLNRHRANLVDERTRLQDGGAR